MWLTAATVCASHWVSYQAVWPLKTVGSLINQAMDWMGDTRIFTKLSYFVYCDLPVIYNTVKIDFQDFFVFIIPVNLWAPALP